jgi:predicted HTH domain antitoxin
MKVMKIEGNIYKKAEKASHAQGMKVNDYLKQALRQGLDSLTEKNVLDQYRAGKISLQRAAELLSSDLWEMIEKIKKAEIPLDYSMEELAEDIK